MSGRADRIDIKLNKQKTESIITGLGVDISKLKTAQIAAVLEPDGTMTVVILATEKQQ